MKQIKWFRNVFLLGATAFVLFFASCNQGNDNKKKDDKKNNQGEATQKFKVEFSLDKEQFTGNAELVAKDGTTKIKSGAEVEKGRTVTFEVTGLTAGYKVKWEGATEDSKDKKKATLKVEKKATVKATIEKEGTTPTPPPAEDPELKLTELKIHTKDVNRPATGDWTVEVDNDKANVKAGDVTAKFTYGSSNTVLDNATVVIASAPVALTAGQAVKVSLSVAGVNGKYKAWKHDVMVTRKVVTPPPAEDPELKLTELKIHTKDVNRPATGDWTVEVDNDKANVKAGDATAKFTYGSSNTVLDNAIVVIASAPVALTAGQAVKVSLSVAGVNGKYKTWKHDVMVTRKVASQPPAEDPELTLTELKIHTKDVNRPAQGDWTVTVPAATTKVEASNVEAKFTYGSVTTPEKLEVTVSPEALQATGETEITLTVAPVSGKYKGWSHKVKVTKEAATPTPKAQKLLTLTVFAKNAQIDTATGNFAASVTLDQHKDGIGSLSDIAGTSGDAPDGSANVGNFEVESIEVTVGSEKKILDATHTDAIPLVTDGNKQTVVTVKTKATATKEAMTITLTITNHD